MNKHAMLFPLLLLCLQTQAAGRYDAQIQVSSERWMPGYDWVWWYAQVKAESGFKPDAVSPAGAGGLAQIMPATYAEHYRKVGLAINANLADRFSVRGSLEVGAYYMAKSIRGWKTYRPPIEKLELGQATYNAGFGNLLDAQKLCRDALLWQQIKKCLPSVTGRHSKETIDYVDRIRRIYILKRSGR